MIYADNAATTAVTRPVLEEMLPYFCDEFGNPSSIHAAGRKAREAVDNARARTAMALGAKSEEIFFTSGGSESDNWAIAGAAALCAEKGRHIVSTAFEHPAVLNTLRALQKRGWEVTFLPVGKSGVVDPSAFEAALRPDTVLATVMYANNEVGTIQPIPALGQICRSRGVLFHTDAVQAAGHVEIDVEAQGIDLLSLSAHKFHGPKGAGALYVRRGLRLPNLIEGGSQERGRRAGTENVPGIAGLGRAVQLAAEGIPERARRLRALSGRLADGLLALPGVRLNGDRERRLPGNVNISVEGVEGESMLVLLDMKGIFASSGSACAAGSVEPSRALLALGLTPEEAKGSLRLTLGDLNTDADVDGILGVLPGIIEHLRALSPAWQKSRRESGT